MFTTYLIRLSVLFTLLATLTSSSQTSSFRFTLNGTPVTAQVSPASCFMMANVITLTAGTSKADIMLEIYRDKFPALPVTLPVKGTSEGVKAFYYPQKMLPANLKPYYVSTEGKLTITHFDAATRTLSGSFSFKAQKFDPERLQSVPGEFVDVSNGTFEGVSYKKI